MRSTLGLLLVLLALPAHAAEWIGRPDVIDGGTYKFGGQLVRLLGVDALHPDQECDGGGQPYACGGMAIGYTWIVIGNEQMRCVGDRRDSQGTPLVRCTVGEFDLGSQMVRAGLAFSDDEHLYDREMADAKAQRVGIWSGPFTRRR